MKKIIALAVAGAFSASAFAADVNVSGDLTYVYVATDKDATEDYISTDDNSITVSASSEIGNGLTVSGAFNLVQDTGSSDDTLDTQGSALTVAGSFGSLTLGDTSGALDATGDWTDKAAWFGGFGADGEDNAVVLSLPTMNGLAFKAGMTPKGENQTTSDDDGVAGAGEGLEAQSYSLTYTMGDFGVYYGVDEFDHTTALKQETTAYGIKYSSGPFYLAYERADAKDAKAYNSSTAGDELDFAGLAATYKMGDITLAIETQEVSKQNATDKFRDETVMSVTYAMGDLTVFAATSSNESTVAANKQDQTAVGVTYAF